MLRNFRQILRRTSMFDEKEDKKKDKDSLVAAAVIAAMAYQAAITPPGGIVQVNAVAAPAPSADYYKDGLKPGKSLIVFFYSSLANGFWINNTIALMASLSVIFLYVSGFSLKRKIQVWAIRVGMWITLTTMAVAYLFAVIATIEPVNKFGKITGIAEALGVTLMVWIGLVFITCFIQISRFLRYVKNYTSAAPAPAPTQENDMV